MRRPRIQQSREIRFLDKGELNSLIETIDVTYGAIDRAIVITAAIGGVRQSELFGLRWCDIDWRRSESVFAGATCAATGIRRSLLAASVRCRSRPESPPSCRRFAANRAFTPAITSSSPTPTPGRCFDHSSLLPLQGGA